MAPLRRATMLRALAVHVPASLIVAMFKMPMQEALGAMVTGVSRPPASFLRNYVTLFTYWIILGVATALKQARDLRVREIATSKLEADLARAQLDVLRMRLHPHFLFNTLNGISALMRDNVEAADLMLTRLSDLLRLTLDRADVQEVPLRDEMEFVRKYLEIQEVRFGDRLTVRVDVAPETLSLALPSLSLQPLVENALRHGIERKPGSAELRVSARRSSTSLVVEIEDDGPGPPIDIRTGIGLDATRRRLEHLFGASANLALERGVNGGAVARLTVPAKVLGA
jgi:LytS/YehU family sensor histidine kinase